MSILISLIIIALALLLTVLACIPGEILFVFGVQQVSNSVLNLISAGLVAVSIILFLLASIIIIRKLTAPVKTPSYQDQDDGKNVIDIASSNLSQINEYYTISKKHAVASFTLAVLFCVFGFATFVLTAIFTSQPTIISIVGGSLCELFAGTSLIVYKNSLSQLNSFYQSLHESERFLSVVALTEQLSGDKQDEMRIKIIESSLQDISNMLHNKGK